MADTKTSEVLSTEAGEQKDLGLYSQGKLKLKTPLWLQSDELSKFIVGFETMPSNKGGEGALFVKLKNKKKYIT